MLLDASVVAPERDLLQLAAQQPIAITESAVTNHA
jgi:hypothetical protein